MVDFNKWRQYRDDYLEVCDLLLDAYLVGFNEGYGAGLAEDNNPEVRSRENLEELVKEAGLDPKVVLRRLYCQQIEENGECDCES
jgi:hypothetical protein